MQTILILISHIHKNTGRSVNYNWVFFPQELRCCSLKLMDNSAPFHQTGLLQLQFGTPQFKNMTRQLFLFPQLLFNACIPIVLPLLLDKVQFRAPPEASSFKPQTGASATKRDSPSVYSARGRNQMNERRAEKASRVVFDGPLRAAGLRGCGRSLPADLPRYPAAIKAPGAGCAE